MLINFHAVGEKASDISYLLGKRPDKLFQKEVTGGLARVYYQNIDDPNVCIFTLDVKMSNVEELKSDSIPSITDYVNDRPYTSSSIIAVAINKVFNTAIQGKDIPEFPGLAEKEWEWKVCIPVIRSNGELIQNLFEPLGYVVHTRRIDDEHPYFRVTLHAAKKPLHAVLNELYMLIQVIDSHKHYRIGGAEINKLTAQSEWLNTHPSKDYIVKKFLGFRRDLINQAASALEEIENGSEKDSEETRPARELSPEDRPEFVSLHQLRHQKVVETINKIGSQAVLEFGCSTGRLLEYLAANWRSARESALLEEAPHDAALASTPIMGVDYSSRAVMLAKRFTKGLNNVVVKHGSALYFHEEYKKYDTVVMTEVIEHIDPERLAMLTNSLWHLAPQHIIFTTPNVEYNVVYGLTGLRHRDHRFEWTRQEFIDWCKTNFPTYECHFDSVGEIHPDFGGPSSFAYLKKISEPAYNEKMVLNHNSSLSIPSRLAERNISVRGDKLKAGLETVSAYCVDPRLLLFAPFTISPVSAEDNGDVLEHPSSCIEYFKKHGVNRIIFEEKHMGSRGMCIIVKDPQVFLDRFGYESKHYGEFWSRTGRPFFNNEEWQSDISRSLSATLTATGFWARYQTDWVMLDTEIMPWNLKAGGLIHKQYAPTGIAAAFHHSSGAIWAGLSGPGQSGPAFDIAVEHEIALRNVAEYTTVWNRYCWDVTKQSVRIAPFTILATEGKVWNEVPHVQHLKEFELWNNSTARSMHIVTTSYRVVDVNDEKQCEEAVWWWKTLTSRLGEGAVVKPADGWVVKQSDGRWSLPALKCRGKEYLRIIYGPNYTENLHLLRRRNVGRKRTLCSLEFALGVESLFKVVERAPLQDIHETVLATIALDAEPLDPRL